MDPIIRPANVGFLLKIETTEGVDASPSATADAIPVEADSVEYGSPWTNEASQEATGSLVAGAPLIIGQPFTIRFRSRIKGANATYTASVKPPLHAALQVCGMRGQFTAAVAAAALTAGAGTTGTLGTGFTGTAQLYQGMPLVLSVGPGAGAMPLITSYSAGKVATLSDTFNPVLDNTTQAALPANWTYAGTSPADNAARATDHPSGTVYIYEDGTLIKGLAMRGTVTFNGQSARPGFAEFELTGIYGGKTDVAIPSNLTVANHMAPTLNMLSAISPSVLVNRLPMPCSQWSIEAGSQLETPDDPNTPYGVGSGIITDRSRVLALDPLATLVAVRNSINEIGAGTQMTAAIRCGSVATNRWSMVLPLGQKIAADPGRRGKLRSEQLRIQALTPGKDAQTRDADVILAFS